MPPPIILPHAANLLTEAQRDVVVALEETLEQARNGLINACGIVACMNKGVAAVMGGTDVAAVYLGAGVLQRQLLERVDPMRGGADDRYNRPASGAAN